MSNPMKTQGSLSVRTSIGSRISLFITSDALERARYLVSKVPTECQWFHRVERQQTAGGYVYILSDIQIPKQKVFPAFVDADPTMMMNLYQKLNTELGREEANEIVNSLTCWCHSHVNMAASPSGQDNKTFEEFIQQDIAANNPRPQVMMIFNKKDEVFTRLYDPELGPIIFENVPLQVESTNVEYPDIDEIIKNDLTPGNSYTGIGSSMGSSIYGRGADWDSLGEKKKNFETKANQQGGAGSAGLRSVQTVQNDSLNPNKNSKTGGVSTGPVTRTNTLGAAFTDIERELVTQMCDNSLDAKINEEAWNNFLSSLHTRLEITKELFVLLHLIDGSPKELLKLEFKDNMETADPSEVLAKLDSAWSDGLIYDELEFLDAMDLASDITKAFNENRAEDVAAHVRYWLKDYPYHSIDELKMRGVL